MYHSNIGQLLQVCNAALKCVFGTYSWYQLFVVQYTCKSNEMHLDSVFILLLHIIFSYMLRSSEPSAGKTKYKGKRACKHQRISLL
jgi:hypothetical protein